MHIDHITIFASRLKLLTNEKQNIDLLVSVVQAHSPPSRCINSVLDFHGLSPTWWFFFSLWGFKFGRTLHQIIYMTNRSRRAVLLLSASYAFAIGFFSSKYSGSSSTSSSKADDISLPDICENSLEAANECLNPYSSYLLQNIERNCSAYRWITAWIDLYA